MHAGLPMIGVSLKEISTTCGRTLSGMNDAVKRWLPLLCTLHGTRPSFTRISMFPEPAFEASTVTKHRNLSLKA